MVAERREHLQHIVSEFEMVKKDQMESCEKVRVSGDEMREVDKFNYLGVMLSTDGGAEEEEAHRVLEGKMVKGTMAKLSKGKMIKRELFEMVVIPTVVYGSETWSLSAQEKRNIEEFEMMCLRHICGIRRVDRVRNASIRENCGCELSVLERIERNVLKLFYHAERMGEERLVKRVG